MTTGIVDDPVFSLHDRPGHPESAKRLESIRLALRNSGMIDRLAPMPTRLAKTEELRLCHEADYITQVEKLSGSGGGLFDSETYLNQYSFEAASKAVGGMIDLAAAITQGTAVNGFALTRPPGHHATTNQGMGFCIFNTVAIAARALQRNCGCPRVAIIDFDVHHGNGTQDLVGDDPAILYVSSHQFPHYPGTGSLFESGQGEAEGTIVNIPLPAGTGDGGLRQVYESVAFPVIRRFGPDFILVSAGFDSHWLDPLAELAFSLAGFDWLIRNLLMLAAELCLGRIAFCLEGGYQTEVLSQAVINTFEAMLEKNSRGVDPYGAPASAEPDLALLVRQLREIHHLENS
jgi:acetoin utilization deacetylase AcuC-like enzyme